MTLLSWNIGSGDKIEGPKKAGKMISSLGADLLFLQEVNKRENEFKVVAPGYLHLPPADEHVKGSVVLNYIAYNGRKLKHTASYFLPGSMFGRTCVGAFEIIGKETACFVAICLHAPYKDKDAQRQYFEALREFVDYVVKTYGVPVVIGGDFNASVCWWQKVFEYSDMHYRPCQKVSLIDFITMKCPKQLQLAYSVTDVQAVEANQMFDHDPVLAMLKYKDHQGVGSDDRDIEEITSGIKNLSAN